MMNTPALKFTPLLATLVAALALTACNRRDESPTAGQVLDRTVNKVEEKAKEVGAEVKAATTKSTDAEGKSTNPVVNSVRDAAITAEIKTLLAKDPGLSALRIDVDTAGGRVALRGTAPSAESRDRATQLAKGVGGVSAVENQLVVKAPSS